MAQGVRRGRSPGVGGWEAEEEGWEERHAHKGLESSLDGTEGNLQVNYGNDHGSRQKAEGAYVRAISVITL